jgi:hypothetical protein
VARDVSARAGLRFVCYCLDCQAFARFLDRADILDAAGGTDIFQMPPGRLRLDAGSDELRCVRLSENVLRWYTRCCKSPIGNTASRARFPILAVIHSFMDHQADGRSRDEVLGAPRCRLYEGSALGPLSPSAPPPPSFAGFGRRATLMLGWLVRGLARPSVFFDQRTGAPRAEPRAITRATAPDRTTPS